MARLHGSLGREGSGAGFVLMSIGSNSKLKKSMSKSTVQRKVEEHPIKGGN